MVRFQVYPWRRPRGWWLRNPRYVQFILREIGGVLAAVYGLVLLLLIYQFRSGPSAYEGFMAALTSPLALALTAVVFGFVLFHAVTWFMLIGKSQLIRFGGKPMRSKNALVLNLIVWVALSIAVFYFIFGGL